MSTVTRSIQQELFEVLGEDDPFDDPNFDPVAYVNAQFPNDHSLEELDNYMLKLQGQMNNLDIEIETLVRRQAREQESARVDLRNTKEHIEILCNDLRNMKSKAIESEALVQEICRDVRSLDFGKRHMQSCVNALEKLIALVTAVDKFQKIAAKRDYQEVERVVLQIESLCEFFEPFAMSAPRVGDLLSQKEMMFGELITQIDEDYDHIWEMKGNLEERVDMQAACRILDLLDGEARSAIIRKFTSRVMEGYQSLFHAGHENAQLASLDRRFAWLRKNLKEHLEDRYAPFFSPQWLIAPFFIEEFSHVTRMQLVDQLALGVNQPKEIPESLRKTHEAEKWLQELVDKQVDQARREHPARRPEHKEGRAVFTSQRWTLPYDLHLQTSQFGPLEGKFRVRGVMTGAFSAYLGSWLQEEESRLFDSLSQAAGSDAVIEDTSSAEGRKVYSSAANVLRSVGQMLQRVQLITRGAAIREAIQIAKKILRRYGEMLSARLPQRAARQTGGLSSEDLAQCAVVASTAGYASGLLDEMLDELEVQCGKLDVESKETALRHLQEATSANSSPFADAKDALASVKSAAVQCLVSSLERRLDGAFSSMSRTNWGGSIEVAGESPFVSESGQVITQDFTAAAKELPQELMRFFADKFAVALANRFQETLLNVRSAVSEDGGSQLLVDLLGWKQHLQKAFLYALLTPYGVSSIEGLGSDSDLSKRVSSQHSAYLRLVARVNRVSDLALKVASSGMEGEDAAGLFRREYLAGGGDPHLVEDLIVKVLRLGKSGGAGGSRHEQGIDGFVRQTGEAGRAAAATVGAVASQAGAGVSAAINFMQGAKGEQRQQEQMKALGGLMKEGGQAVGKFFSKLGGK